MLDTTSRGEKSDRLSLSLPASIAEMSSTSSTSAISVRVEAWMVRTHSRCSSSRRVVASNSDMPPRPLSGVRNSWLMLARNRLLASLARRASSVARVNCLSRLDRYSGTAARPTSRPTPRPRSWAQKSLDTSTVPKLATAIATATYR